MTRSYFVPAFFSLLLLALGALSGGPVQRAEAQPTPTLTEELETALQSRSWLQRYLALLDVSSIANCPGECTFALYTFEDREFTFLRDTEMGTGTDMSTGEVVDLAALSPELVSNYRLGPDDRSRMLALSALLGIGDETGLNVLLEDAPSQSETVNRTTQKSITAFYLDRYPELARTARMNGGEIAFRDIDRAKKMRDKQAVKAQQKIARAGGGR